MKAKMKKFPKTPFKLDCGDKPEVRQWLNGNGCKWPYSGQATEGHLDKKHLFVDSSRELNYCNESIFFNNDESALFNPFKKKSKLEARVEALEGLLSERSITGVTGDGCIDETLQVQGVINKYSKQNTYIDKRQHQRPVNVGRYKPKPDEEYYFIDRNGRMALTGNNGYVIDIHNISTGNCYRTKQEAEQALARQQALVRVNDRIDELNDTIYNDVVKGEKWYIDYISCSGDIHFDYVVLARPCSVFNPLYCEENAKLLISEMEDDIRLAVGWEK